MIIRFDDGDASARAGAYAFVHETVTSAEIVHVLGPVDLSNLPAFEQTIADVVRPGRPLVVDLNDCTYIGATGFSALVRAHKRCGGRLAIAVSDGGIPALLFSLFAERGPLRVEQSLERAISASVSRRPLPDRC